MKNFDELAKFFFFHQNGWRTKKSGFKTFSLKARVRAIGKIYNKKRTSRSWSKGRIVDGAVNKCFSCSHMPFANQRASGEQLPLFELNINIFASLKIIYFEISACSPEKNYNRKLRNFRRKSRYLITCWLPNRMNIVRNVTHDVVMLLRRHIQAYKISYCC
jgi:hypothetical protein